MRHPFRFVALVPFVLAGCADGAGPLAVDVAYQLTCSGTPGANCMPVMLDHTIWDYAAKNGKEVVDGLGNSLGTVSARCSASSVADGVVQISMRTELEGDYLQIEGLRLARADGAFVGGACRVSVYDGSVLYGGSSHGACSNAAPNLGTPCQITASSINHDAMDGPLVELRLLCNELPNSNQPTSRASVRDSQSTSAPAIVRVSNCRGL